MNYRIEMMSASLAALRDHLKDVPADYTALGFAKSAVDQAQPIADEEHPCRTDPSAPCCGKGCQPPAEGQDFMLDN